MARQLTENTVTQSLCEPLALDDMICSVSGRTLRPSPLSNMLRQLTWYHFDLEGNTLLKGLMASRGLEVTCSTCGVGAEYLGTSMSIEAAKNRETVLGGIRLVSIRTGHRMSKGV